jgi:conjugal transfer/entry exclusion protein
MKSQNKQNEIFSTTSTENLNNNQMKQLQDEIRFWQNVSLNLALFAFGLIASLFTALIFALMKN